MDTDGSPTPPPPIAPLLGGYWAFGQYWGVWVILVFEFQGAHHTSDSRLGILYTLLSVVAVAVMLLLAPRLQPWPLRRSVPVALMTLAIGSFAIGYLPTSAIALGFVLVGAGNGLIDVYLNVAAQRAEVATRRPVLQWLHASYALGGVTGAGAAGLIRLAGIDYRVGLAYAAALLGVTAVWNSRTASTEPGAEGLRDGVLHLRAVPIPGPVGPGARGAVRVPGGGIDGHVVRPLPARAASAPRP